MLCLLLLSAFSCIALSSVQDLPAKDSTSTIEPAGQLSYVTARASSGDFTSPGDCGGNKSHICAPWSYCSQNGTCTCPSLRTSFTCDPDGYITGILSCHCVTYDEEEDLLEVGECLYNCIGHKILPSNEAYQSLPKNRSEWNNVTCAEYNRHGTLCSQCNEGFYPLANSFTISCALCHSHDWWKYILSITLPLTVFYLIVLLLKINIPNSRLLGYVFFCQILTTPLCTRIFIHYDQVAEYIISIYGIWNLDFLHFFKAGFCLQTTNTLEILALDLAVGVYPLFLIAITYIFIRFYDSKLAVFMKPYCIFFCRFPAQWNIRNSIVGTFATFLLLANVKFLNACTGLLIPIRVYQFVTLHQINSTWRLYYDASIPYFGTAHLPYAILAIAVLFFFVISPTLLLLLYPFAFCHKCLNQLPRRGQIFLHIFVDSFQGCYKNGTEPGTRDCRWFSAVPFITHILLFIVGGSTLNSLILPYTAMVVTLLTLIAIQVNPFKHHLNYLFSRFIAYMTFLTCIIVVFEIKELFLLRRSDIEWTTLKVCLLLFAMSPIFLSSLTLYWTIIHCRLVGCIRCIKAWRQGYSLELMQ